MSNQKDIFSTTEGRWDFVIAIVVMALVGYFLYATTFKDPVELAPIEVPMAADDQSELTQSPAIAVKVKANEQNTTWANEPPYRVSKVKRSNALDGDIEGAASIITDYDLPENAELETPIEKINTEINEAVESLPTEVEAIQEAAPEVIKPVETAPAEVQPKEQKAIVPKPAAPKATPKPTPKAPVATIPNNTNCAVIVGSFANPENFNGIVQKLQEMGYDIVKGETRPGLDYVGVPVDCGDSEKQSDLVEKLNRTFNIKSWVKKK